MIQMIKNVLGLSQKVNTNELIANGAIVIDVRTRGEFSSGHAKGAINVPLDQLPGYVEKQKNKESTIITCCASGIRSASAKRFLKEKGYKNVYNAGPWLTLNKYCK